MRISLLALLLAAVAFAASPASAQTRSDWQMNRGQGHLDASSIAHGNEHGNPAFYALATIPAESDPNWGPAPNPETIGFSESSTVACFQAVDFTYFQTFVDVPANAQVNTFTIAFDGMDDGSRVTVFNADHPQGIVDEGSYVKLGGTGTADLARYLATGRNRIVVTQMDDCANQNNLRSATVVLNGSVVETEPTAEAPANACAALPGANSWGDVHISTPDGTVYDFQAAGEFLLLASNDGEVVVQSRQQPWESNPRVTVNKAVALNVAGTRVGVYLEPGPVVYVGDSRVEVESGTPTVLPGGGSICEVGGGGTASYRITWASGFTVGVRAFAGSHIDVGVARGGSGSVGFSGLIGDLDGNGANDMRVRGGSVLTSPLAFEALYSQFGDSWRITASESLFRYAGGSSTATYNQNGTPTEPLLLTDLNPTQRDRARAACVAAGVTTPALLGGCTLDVAGTGSAAFTASAVSAEVTVQTAGATVEGGMVGGGATMFPLLAGTDLVRGQRYYNESWTHYMIFQDDGNVVVYTADNGYVWGLESVTSSYSQITSVSVTSDGNFVAYGSGGNVIWSALTSGGGARTRLGLTRRGVLQLRSQRDGLWSNVGGTSETIEVDGTVILTGDVQVTLQWSTPVDLDLYVTDPAGDEVSYQNTSVPSGGVLDVDARRSCQATPETVENIVWTGTAPRGDYGIRVNYYTACDQGPADYTVTLRRGGEVVETWTGTLSYSESVTYPFSN